MENTPIQFEWILSKEQNERKRYVNIFLVFLLLLLFFLQFIFQIIPALLIVVLLVVSWNYKYSGLENKASTVFESYKINGEGIFIDNIETGARNFYSWSELSHFESWSGGIPILGMAISSLADDNIKVTKTNKKSFVLRIPDSKTLTSVGNILIQKLLIRIPPRSGKYSYYGETFYDVRTKKYFDKNLKDVTDIVGSDIVKF